MATEPTDIVLAIEKMLDTIKPVLKYLGKVRMSSLGDHARGAVVAEDRDFVLAFLTTGITVLLKTGGRAEKTLHKHVVGFSLKTVEEMQTGCPKLFDVAAIRKELIALMEGREQKLRTRADNMHAKVKELEV